MPNRLFSKLVRPETPFRPCMTFLRVRFVSTRKNARPYRLLVIADQFEELFTLTPETDRTTFSNALLRALACVPDRAPFTLIVTLREDFYSQAIALNRELSDRLPSTQGNIGSLTRDELERSICQP